MSPLQIPKEIPQEDYFSRTVYWRIFSQHNLLCLITGPTGIGKSWMGLKLCETYDPHFTPDQIIFTVPEFLNAIKRLPSRSFILWDEPGVFVGHREWLSLSNKIVAILMQSFRYKFINVFFALPDMHYMDKVAREMCHYQIKMINRGHGSVYSIRKNPLTGWMYTPYIGELVSIYPPSKELTNSYENLRQEHMDSLIQGMSVQLEAAERRQKERLDRALHPRKKRSFAEMVEKAHNIIDEIHFPDRPLRKGRININIMREKLNIGHNLAYRIRDKLLRDLEEKE